MLKSVKVNYPKRKPRLRLEDLVDVSEPERYSMYQVLLDNLKIANRATFVHRIVYVGSHFFGSYEDATDVFENIITRSNETYCIEKLTGFFLYYPHYFVHVMEGDEDNLNKHLGFLLDKKAKHADRLGVTKLLIHVSHINQRFFENWIHFTGVPPKLLEQLDISGDLLQSGRYIYNCIKKIYSLIGNYADDLTIAAENVVPPKRSCDVGTLSSEESEHASHIFPSFSYASHQSTSLDRSDLSCTKDYKLFLPEYEMLDFILKSQYTMKLEEYYGLYGVVPMRDIYKDRVWPVPHDFIPYDVFEKPYDCITELPKDSWRNKPLVTTPSGTPIDKSRAKFAEDTKDKENLKNEKTKS